MAEQEASPLAGLTEQEADEAIDRLKAKVDQGIGGQAAKDHLKAMKAARKDHAPPVPPEQRSSGNGTKVNADPAEISMEGGGR